MRAQNLPPELVEAIAKNLKPLVNVRKVKPGASFEVRLNSQGSFVNFTYQAGPLDVYQITADSEGRWRAEKKAISVEKYWARVSGEISSNLFEAMDRLGERDTLVLEFAEIFAWEIDFHSDLQPGDRLGIVVEKYYVQDTFVKYGRILYAEIQRENRKHQAFFFDPTGKRADYFTLEGNSVRKAFLRSPLKFTRVSSGYSRSRYHPVLGGNRPHLGVDYAAPNGNPVWAVADGAVIACGLNGGYGKQVVIRHPGGYRSMYGHLSRFAPGIARGKTVRQKQVIGYVGSTGLSTGPHLDFRLQKNGAFRDPLKETSPRAAPVSAEQKKEFQKSLAPVLEWVNDPSGPPWEKVASLTSQELEHPVPGKRK